VEKKNCSIDDFPYQRNGLNSVFYHMYIIILHFVSPGKLYIGFDFLSGPEVLTISKQK